MQAYTLCRRRIACAAAPRLTRGERKDFRKMQLIIIHFAMLIIFMAHKQVLRYTQPCKRSAILYILRFFGRQCHVYTFHFFKIFFCAC